MYDNKIYFKVKDRPEEVKVSMGYELGGINYFSGRENARGYYIYVQPVTRSTSESGYRIESTMLFDGFKELAIAVNRQSKKAELTAVQKLSSRAMVLALQLAGRQGWELAGMPASQAQ